MAPSTISTSADKGHPLALDMGASKWTCSSYEPTVSWIQSTGLSTPAEPSGIISPSDHYFQSLTCIFKAVVNRFQKAHQGAIKMESSLKWLNSFDLHILRRCLWGLGTYHWDFKQFQRFWLLLRKILGPYRPATSSGTLRSQIILLSRYTYSIGA